MLRSQRCFWKVKRWPSRAREEDLVELEMKNDWRRLVDRLRNWEEEST